MSDPNKIKITYAGQLCRKCNYPVIEIKRKKPTFKNKSFYCFMRFFRCLQCNTNYLDPESIVYKKEKETEQSPLFN